MYSDQIVYYMDTPNDDDMITKTCCMNITPTSEQVYNDSVNN
jgi:hypothetical protein